MRRQFGRRAYAAALFALCMTAAGTHSTASQAGAAPPQGRSTVIAWSTYLRSGPGATYPAIAELEHDTSVAVGGCSGSWCRVSAVEASGFVDRDALELPRTFPPQPPASADCVVVGQADNRGPIPTRFCSAPTAR